MSTGPVGATSVMGAAGIPHGAPTGVPPAPVRGLNPVEQKTMNTLRDIYHDTGDRPIITIRDQHIRTMAEIMANHNVSDQTSAIKTFLSNQGFSADDWIRQGGLSLPKLGQEIKKIRDLNHQIETLANDLVSDIDNDDLPKAKQDIDKLDRLAKNNNMNDQQLFAKLNETSIDDAYKRKIMNALENHRQRLMTAKRDQALNDPVIQNIQTLLDDDLDYYQTPEVKLQTLQALANDMRQNQMDTKQLQTLLNDAGIPGALGKINLSLDELDHEIERQDIEKKDLNDLQAVQNILQNQPKEVNKLRDQAKILYDKTLDPDNPPTPADYQPLAKTMNEMGISPNQLGSILTQNGFNNIPNYDDTAFQNLVHGDDLNHAQQADLLRKPYNVEIQTLSDKIINGNPNDQDAAYEKLAEVLYRNGIQVDDKLDSRLKTLGIDPSKIDHAKLQAERNKAKVSVTNQRRSKIFKYAMITAAAVAVVGLAVLGVGLIAGGIALTAGFPPTAPLGVAMIFGGGAVLLGAVGALGMSAMLAFMPDTSQSAQQAVQKAGAKRQAQALNTPPPKPVPGAPQAQGAPGVRQPGVPAGGVAPASPNVSTPASTPWSGIPTDDSSPRTSSTTYYSMDSNDPFTDDDAQHFIPSSSRRDSVTLEDEIDMEDDSRLPSGETTTTSSASSSSVAPRAVSFNDEDVQEAMKDYQIALERLNSYDEDIEIRNEKIADAERAKIDLINLIGEEMGAQFINAEKEESIELLNRLII